MTGSRKKFILTTLVCSLAVVFVHALLTLNGWAEAGAVSLPDGDSFMRYIRVVEMLESGDWYNSTIPRSNTPFGEFLAWSHPLDVLLLAGAWPLLALGGLELREALQLWGSFLSPLFLIGSVAALLWAVVPLRLFRRVEALMVAIFLFIPVITKAYGFGVADHHGLLNLLFIVLLGLALRMEKGSLSTAAEWGAGALCGLGIWIGPEFTLPLALVTVWMGLLWAFGDNKKAASLRHLYGGALLVLLVAWPLEQNPLAGDLWRVEHDRLSILHVALVGSGTLLTTLLHEAGKLLKPFRFRLLAGMGGGALLFTVMLLLFPRFYMGPLAAMDARLLEAWYPFIGQFHSALASRSALTCSLIFFAFLLPVFLGVGKTPLPKKERRRWYGLVFLALVFMVVASLQTRWLLYSSTLYAILLARVVVLFAEQAELKHWRWPICQRLVAPVLFPLAVLAPALSNTLPTSPNALPEAREYAQCTNRLRAMIQTDEVGKILGNHRARVFTSITYGPNLLFWTNHSIVAWSAHRNVTGLVDSYRIFWDEDTPATAEELREIARRRGLNAVLYCPIQFTEETLAPHLFNRPWPDWLTPVHNLERRLEEPVLLRVEKDRL